MKEALVVPDSPPQGPLVALEESRAGLVSVVIPTRDRYRLLRRAVASALAQTDARIEVIVVDDASQDGTQRAMEEFALGETRLRYLRTGTAGGACQARNLGLQHARGEFVTFLDDDDRLAPDHVARLRAAYRPAYAFVGSAQSVVYRDRTVAYALHAGVVSLDALLHYNRFGIQVLVERTRLLALGGFDPTLPALQDYDLCVRLVAAHGPALKTADATYFVSLDTGFVRISGGHGRQAAALARFRGKHRAHMSPSHLRSMELLALKQTQAPIGLRKAWALAAPGNRLAVLSLLINTRAPWLQRFYHRLRGPR